MPKIDLYVLHLVQLQGQLTDTFKKKFPNANDFDWLVNFPKQGIVIIEAELWEFTKHGRGLRFIRKFPRPNYVVDIHTAFGESSYIDDWRLIQFLESCGKRIEKKDILTFLEGMVSEGVLSVSEDGCGYLLNA